MKGRLGVLLAMVVLGACQLEESTRPRLLGVSTPVTAISDGTSGGNPDFFFFQPLAGNPLSHPNIEQGGENNFLAPYAIVCEITNTPGETDCLDDVTPVAGGIPLTRNGDNYSENWRTSDAPGLSSAKFYRIEVFAVPVPNREAVTADFITKFRYGYRDIDPDNGPSVSACDVVEFCKVNNGSTIPIKTRIEAFASCPETRACSSEVVKAGQQNNLKQPSGNQITVPGQSSDFFLNFDVCSAAEEAAVNDAIDLPTFGPCFKTETPFTGTLSSPATLSICEPITFIPPEYSHSQEHQIALHHFDTQGGTPSNPITRVEALSEANNCLTVTGDASRGTGFKQLARVVARNITALFKPQPLYAVALDVGGGGLVDDLSSFFKLALPGKFVYVNTADAGPTTLLTGSNVTLQAKVVDLKGDPIYNARVRWNVASSPVPGASFAPTISYTNTAGIAQAVVTISTAPGTNNLQAAGKGIADSRTTGCSLLGGTPGAASCNGPRTGAPNGPFDPFSPLNQSHDGTLGTTAVELASGTFIPYTIIGCDVGQGSANVNGTLGVGEWDCANSTTFPVNLSGGATTATLRWMNNATHMYIAISIPGTGRENSLRLDWDNNGNSAGLAQGTRELGDDVWEFVHGSGTTDKWLDSKCVGSSQTNCGTDDGAGKNQTVASFNNTAGGMTVYELSHPLNSGDGFDIAAAVGQTKGLQVTLRMGSGAQGNTQWPGFRKYLALVIK